MSTFPPVSEWAKKTSGSDHKTASPPRPTAFKPLLEATEVARTHFSVKAPPLKEKGFRRGSRSKLNRYDLISSTGISFVVEKNYTRKRAAADIETGAAGEGSAFPC
jgi:hypothetical protein